MTIDNRDRRYTHAPCECGDAWCSGCETDDARECRGHPVGPYDPMGETVYCDGSCLPPVWADQRLHCYREDSPTAACRSCGQVAEAHTGCDC